VVGEVAAVKRDRAQQRAWDIVVTFGHFVMAPKLEKPGISDI